MIDFARWNLERKLRRDSKSRPEIEEYYTQDGVIERIRRLDNKEQWEIPVSRGESERSIVEIMEVKSNDSTENQGIEANQGEQMRKMGDLRAENNHKVGRGVFLESPERRVVPGLEVDDLAVIQRVDALMGVVSTLRNNYVRHMKKSELLKKSD